RRRVYLRLRWMLSDAGPSATYAAGVLFGRAGDVSPLISAYVQHWQAACTTVVSNARPTGFYRF
ncbi:MAG: hypothetical protein ABGZ24_00945, partial [Fuerstiella sp.]